VERDFAYILNILCVKHGVVLNTVFSSSRFQAFNVGSRDTHVCIGRMRVVDDRVLAQERIHGSDHIFMLLLSPIVHLWPRESKEIVLQILLHV
jgi:hypothetical protein